MRSALAITGVFLLATFAGAHPVPQSNHDRTIVVRFEPGPLPGQIAVRVDYRLEVDPATVILEDMKPFQDQIDVTQFKNKLDYFKEFTRIYAPVLVDRLIARHNGVMVDFVCLDRQQTLKDEKDQPLDHLRCDFVFRAVLSCSSDKENVFSFREGNYQEQEGLINLSLSNETNLSIVSKIEPDSSVKNRPPTERLPGDDAKLRLVQVHFTLPSQPIIDVPASMPDPAPSTPRAIDGHDSGLLRLLLHGQYGFWLLLLASAGIGALHALTPGHGKTLVAAYLVGERGTLWHAVLLGLVTTVTHTGAVLTIALALWFVPASSAKETQDNIQTGLGLGMGLVIVCLGFYLLLLRLSGRADHIHIGGGHHHHHQASGPPASQSKVSTSGLILLGISGGLIPCWDAIAMLVFAVATNNLQFAFPMLLAFSAGLAGVLVLVGILVVKFRNFAGSRWGEGRLVRALPIVSAVLVTAMGFWLCYEAVHGR